SRPSSKGTQAIGTAAAGAGAGTSQAKARPICVGSTPGCFSTIQAAVDAAKDGERITIASGTYAGGITVDVSVKIVGAGADKTIISGGGPVITIGSFGASTEPTVSISGVTITGGVTHASSPSSSAAAAGDDDRRSRPEEPLADIRFSPSRR